MDKGRSIRQLSVEHNAHTKRRASVQQKLFVLDYIRLNNCSISKAVAHFISIGCKFKISISTVSDWKLKENQLRFVTQEMGNEVPRSVLLSRRIGGTFKYPLIVQEMEARIQPQLRQGVILNETMLKSMWKELAKSYQSYYKLTDKDINDGPSKGFIYRFKQRNGLGSHHEQKLLENIDSEQSGLKNSELSTVSDELQVPILRISNFIKSNQIFFKNSEIEWQKFLQLYQLERQQYQLLNIRH